MPRRWSQTEIADFFSRFAAQDPDPRSELQYNNPYTLLVAVVLSAQATDKGVNKATAPLFAHIDTPEKMLALGEDSLREAIRTIGLYRTKAKNVIALSRALIEKHGGAVPRERELLETLPSVGRKTANVVLNVAFGEPTIARSYSYFLAKAAARFAMINGRDALSIPPDSIRTVQAEIATSGSRLSHWAEASSCPAASPAPGTFTMTNSGHRAAK